MVLIAKSARKDYVRIVLIEKSFEKDIFAFLIFNISAISKCAESGYAKVSAI